MRDCPQPSTSHFPWAMVTRSWVGGAKVVAVVGPLRCREGVVERGEMLGDFDEPFYHRMVLQSSPRIRTMTLLRKKVRRPDNGKKIEDKSIRLRQGGHDYHVGYSGTLRMGQSGHTGRQCLRTKAGWMASSACVRLPLTLGGLGGIILHDEGTGGSCCVRISKLRFICSQLSKEWKGRRKCLLKLKGGESMYQKRPRLWSAMS